MSALLHFWVGGLCVLFGMVIGIVFVMLLIDDAPLFHEHQDSPSRADWKSGKPFNF